MSMWADFLTNQQRPINKWPHYFPAYERHLSRFRNLSVSMLEIGCGSGGSLQMWKRYLGPMAQIVGVDISPKCERYEEHQIAVRIGDQSDPEFLATVDTEFGPFDIVLDDGSHQMEHIAASFHTLYPKLRQNGVYMVEDLHACYRAKYGGGYKVPGSFIELCKDLIDELNADHTKGAVPLTEFNRTTTSMHFYDSMAVFERGRHLGKASKRVPRKPRPRPADSSGGVP